MVRDEANENKFSFVLVDSLSQAADRQLLVGYKVHVTKNVKPEPNQMRGVYHYFTSAVDAVDFSHMTASSSALWSRFSSPFNCVNGLVSTMWFMICRWPQSQEGDWVRLLSYSDNCGLQPYFVF